MTEALRRGGGLEGLPDVSWTQDQEKAWEHVLANSRPGTHLVLAKALHEELGGEHRLDRLGWASIDHLDPNGHAAVLIVRDELTMRRAKLLALRDRAGDVVDRLAIGIASWLAFLGLACVGAWQDVTWRLGRWRARRKRVE